MTQETGVSFYPRYEDGSEKLSPEQLRAINHQLSENGVSPETARVLFANRECLNIPDPVKEKMYDTLRSVFGMKKPPNQPDHEASRDIEAVFVVESFGLGPSVAFEEYATFNSETLNAYSSYTRVKSQVSFATYVQACLSATLSAKLQEGAFVDAQLGALGQQLPAGPYFVIFSNYQRGLDKIQKARTQVASTVYNLPLIDKAKHPQVIQEVFLPMPLVSKLVANAQVRAFTNVQTIVSVGTGLVTLNMNPFNVLEPILYH